MEKRFLLCENAQRVVEKSTVYLHYSCIIVGPRLEAHQLEVQ